VRIWSLVCFVSNFMNVINGQRDPWLSMWYPCYSWSLAQCQYSVVCVSLVFFILRRQTAKLLSVAGLALVIELVCAPFPKFAFTCIRNLEPKFSSEHISLRECLLSAYVRCCAYFLFTQKDKHKHEGTTINTGIFSRRLTRNLIRPLFPVRVYFSFKSTMIP
jgi:hypothetical protein